MIDAAMLFNSLEFALFIAIVYPLYLLANHRLQNRLLLAASYFFYGSWDWRFLSLILISTVVDYFTAIAIERHSSRGKKRAFLLVSVATNLGLLGAFKYFNFFVDSAAQLLSVVGMKADMPTLYIVLPVGISFYTFQTMSYTLEVYRGGLKPTRNFLDFALFVSFFPQLVAGPIERATNLLPQVLRPRTVTVEQSTRGLYLVLLGLFKKIVIADGVSFSVDQIFGAAAGVNGFDVALATLLFAVQIYGDFSGYSDIARGVAKLMGFELMTNFRMPYFSVSPSEFWQRWHISLSSWLRDYLYIPLGGNRSGALGTYRNLMLTMALGGLWHGPAWNFVLWGIYQGAVLCVYRLLSGSHESRARLRPVLHQAVWLVQWGVFFILTCYGWLLFRASSLAQITEFTRLLLTDWGGFDSSVLRPPLATLLGMAALAVVEIAEESSGTSAWYRRMPSYVRGLLFASLITIFIMGLSNASGAFIYFQF